MAKIDDVQAAVTQLKQDQVVAFKDVSDKIAALVAAATDPAEAAKLQAIADDIAAMDASVKEFDPGPQA